MSSSIGQTDRFLHEAISPSRYRFDARLNSLEKKLFCVGGGRHIAFARDETLTFTPSLTDLSIFQSAFARDE